MRPTAATSHKTVSLPNLLFFFTLLRAGQSHHHETSDNRQILEVESLRDPSFTFVRVPSGHLDRSGRGLGKTSELPHATCAASALTLTFLHTHSFRQSTFLFFRRFDVTRLRIFSVFCNIDKATDQTRPRCSNAPLLQRTGRAKRSRSSGRARDRFVNMKS